MEKNMAVAVQFPDGSIRDIPGYLRKVASSDLPRYEQIPLNHDARWRFERCKGGWIAFPRLGHIVSMRSPLSDWWISIDQMQDGRISDTSEDRNAA